MKLILAVEFVVEYIDVVEGGGERGDQHDGADGQSLNSPSFVWILVEGKYYKPVGRTVITSLKSEV